MWANIAEGFGGGIFFTVVILIPAIGGIAVKYRQAQRRRKRARANRLRKNAVLMAQRDSSRESSSIRDMGASGNHPLGPANEKTSQGTHGVPASRPQRRTS
jgi:hypothetical protein